MLASELDFELPPDLIAQVPAVERQASRLLSYRRDDRSITQRTFADLPTLLRAGDLLVFNDARVLPARFVLRKISGGRIEGLFLQELSAGRWLAMLRNLGDAPAGTVLTFANDPAIAATVLQTLGEGEYQLQITPAQAAAELLERVGRMPLPPYIKRDRRADVRDDLDRQRYQTVYASAAGAVAAPTAGLHFTPALLAELAAMGVQRAMVTLHVGAGTFKPVTVEDLADHAMHAERYSIDSQAADMINRAKADRRRIIAVGTTSARVLESQPAEQPIQPRTAETAIFIYPPYRWKYVEAMITNFHLPRSTLIALVAALVGLDEQKRIYREAIARRYRFFSYGDAMWVE